MYSGSAQQSFYLLTILQSGLVGSSAAFAAVTYVCKGLDGVCYLLGYWMA